jgi:HEAT repeat protein
VAWEVVVTAHSRRKKPLVSGATKPVEAYIAALDDADSQVRRQAAAALELLGDKGAVAPLLAKLHDEDAQVRGNVARALGRLRDK